MQRILLDQGIPRGTAVLLRDAGLDACHVGELGLARASDQEILDLSRVQGRICCTLDADFHRLLAAAGASAPSVVRVRVEGLKSAEMARLIQRVLDEAGSALAHGAAVTVTARAIRVRSLPLRSRR